MGEVIAILSGKGGTGKSALCAGVGTALSNLGKKVLCVDGDVGLGNLDVFLGVDQNAPLSFADICRGNYDISKAAVHPDFPNLTYLAAPIGDFDISPKMLGDFLKSTGEKFDFILIDCPAGLGDRVSLFAECAHRSIVVTLPDPAALRGATRTGQHLELLGVHNVRMVVNRVFPELLKALKMNVDDMMDETGLALLGVVPTDPDVSIAAAKGKALQKYKRSGASAAYIRIAKRIQGLSVPISGR